MVVAFTLSDSTCLLSGKAEFTRGVQAWSRSSQPTIESHITGRELTKMFALLVRVSSVLKFSSCRKCFPVGKITEICLARQSNEELLLGSDP